MGLTVRRLNFCQLETYNHIAGAYYRYYVGFRQNRELVDSRAKMKRCRACIRNLNEQVFYQLEYY